MRAVRGERRTLPGARHEASTLPALPGVSSTATACPGRGRDGRVLCLGRQLPRPRPAQLRGQLFQNRLGDVEVGEHLVDVVLIVEHLEQVDHPLGVLAGQLDRAFRFGLQGG